MTRKQIPQPLAISSSANDDISNGPPSSRSLKSPKSPRSPFRFSSKPAQTLVDQQLMPGAELNLSSSPPGNSIFSSQQSQQSSTSGRKEKQERDQQSTSPAKSGFFSNYKASKSSSRLQPAGTIQQVSEEAMSKDTDTGTMNPKVSTSETKGSGETYYLLGFIKIRSNS